MLIIFVQENWYWRITLDWTQAKNWIQNESKLGFYFSIWKKRRNYYERLIDPTSQNHIYEIKIRKALGQGQRNARTDFRFFGCELNFLPTVNGKNRLLSYAMLVKSNFCTRFYLFGFSFRLFRFLVFFGCNVSKIGCKNRLRKKATDFIFSVLKSVLVFRLSRILKRTSPSSSNTNASLEWPCANISVTNLTIVFSLNL